MFLKVCRIENWSVLYTKYKVISTGKFITVTHILSSLGRWQFIILSAEYLQERAGQSAGREHGETCPTSHNKGESRHWQGHCYLSYSWQTREIVFLNTTRDWKHKSANIIECGAHIGLQCLVGLTFCNFVLFLWGYNWHSSVRDISFLSENKFSHNIFMEVFRQFVKNIYPARLFSAEHLFYKENCPMKPHYNNKRQISIYFNKFMKILP